MLKISTMQKLSGLSLLLCLFTVIVGLYGVRSLNDLSSDVEELSSMHMKGLNLLRMANIEVLRIIREEKNLIISTTDEGNRIALDNLRKEYVTLDKYVADMPRYFIDLFVPCTNNDTCNCVSTKISNCSHFTHKFINTQ